MIIQSEKTNIKKRKTLWCIPLLLFRQKFRKERREEEPCTLTTLSLDELECWEILQELKGLDELDSYDKEELEIQQNTLEEYFQEYRTYTREPAEDQLEAAMEKVLEWNKEREHLLEGTVPEKSLGR